MTYESLAVLVGMSGHTIVMLTKEIVYGWNRPWSWGGGELNEKSHISFLVSREFHSERKTCSNL